MNRFCNAATIFTLLAGGAAITVCAATSAPQTLPSVRGVHARFIAALGGADALLRPRSITTRPNLNCSKLTPGPGIQRPRSGYNDGVGYGVNPYPGATPQIAKDEFLQSARRDADIYYWAHISRYFRSEYVVGTDTFAGHTCYHVRGITKWGNENNHYFDTRSGLLAGYGFHQWNASNTGREGTLTRQILSDYRNFGGLLIPLRIDTVDGGRFIVREQDTSIRFNDVDNRIFALPPSVIAATRSERS
jgi:hypothetical protein